MCVKIMWVFGVCENCVTFFYVCRNCAGFLSEIVRVFPRWITFFSKSFSGNQSVFTYIYINS